MNDETVGVLTIFIIIIVCSGMIEGAFLLYLFFTSDETSCNLFWCTFTTTKSSSISNIETTRLISVTQDCYENGQLINCSQIGGDIP